MDSHLLQYVRPTLYALLGLLVLMLFHKITTCKIKIIQFYKVRNGHVVKVGRYREATDSATKQKYLAPMFGNKNLPFVDYESTQKVNGVPIVGINRELKLVFPDEYNPYVMLPNGELEALNNKLWIFNKNKSDFIKKFARSNFINFIQIFAPTIVIIGALLFWAFAIYLQLGITNQIGESVQQNTEILKNVLQK